MGGGEGEGGMLHLERERNERWEGKERGACYIEGKGKRGVGNE